MLRTRIAPTPSGYLHLGNVFNFLLIWLHARMEHGRIYLRIDDLDKERVKIEYIDNIFQTLDQLGIDWDEGPQYTEDHLRNFSQIHFIEDYQLAINHLIDKQLVFACTCSRKAISDRHASGYYTGTCLFKNFSIDTPQTVLRLKHSINALATLMDKHYFSHKFQLPESMHYSIIRRRDLVPAYQIASLCDDKRMGINYVIRGNDLLDSSIFQSYLAELLEYDTFQQIRFYHHGLLKNSSGNKLSKSQNALSVHGKSPEDILTAFCQWLGWKTYAQNTDELLSMAKQGLPIYPENH